jgi:protein phosphatase
MNPMKTITAEGLTDQGRVRKQNEDNYFVDLEQGLFIVSDGMGGHVAGELASRIVVEVLPPYLSENMESIQDLSDPKATAFILETLSDLSAHIRNESNKRPEFAGMGATIVLALIRDDHVLIAHIGDSRAYLLRGERFEQLTKDHSIIQILIDTGEITQEEVATHPARSKITQYVGMNGEVLPEIRVIELLPYDRLLLCTDGLTGMVADSIISELLLKNPNPEYACRTLVDTANAVGGKDNITVIVVDSS